VIYKFVLCYCLNFKLVNL